MGIDPKKALGEFRLIHHLSFLEGESVNDAIPGELCSVRYTSFDEAVKMIRSCAVGAELTKADVKSALGSYRFTCQTLICWVSNFKANTVLY